MRREREEYRKERRTVSPGRKKELRREVIEKQRRREIVGELAEDPDGDQSNVCLESEQKGGDQVIEG